jgi:hypothetical protein
MNIVVSVSDCSSCEAGPSCEEVSDTLSEGRDSAS